jgi:hypothetical protein
MKRHLLVPLMLMIFSCAVAQENQHLSHYGKWPYGVSYTMEIKGNTVFTTDGGVLQIYDYTDPTSPALLSELFCADVIYSMRAVDNKVYIANYDGSLIIVDVTDLSKPFKLAELETLPLLGSIDVRDNYAYITSDENGLIVVDVSDAANPFVVNHLAIDSKLYKVLIHEQLLFVSGLQAGIRVYDLEDPALPDFLSMYDTTSYETDMVAVGNRLYAASFDHGILTLDISNPVSPIKFVSFSGTTNKTVSIDISGSTAIVCEYEYGIALYDIADEYNPAVIGRFTAAPFHSKRAMFKGEHAILSGLNTLQLLDISNPSQILELHRFKFHGSSRNITQWENRVYVTADSPNGSEYPIRILDISDPTHPVEAPLNLTSIGNGKTVHAKDDLLFVSDGSLVKIFDMQDVMNPVQVDSVPCSQYYPLIHKHNDLLFVADYSKLYIYDISDLNNIVLVKTMDKGVKAIDTKDQHLLIGTFLGFEIYDISDPSNIQKVFDKQAFSTISVAWGMNSFYVLTGSTVYLGDYCIEVYNTENMSSIHFEKRFSCGIVHGAIVAENNFLYLTDWRYGIQVYDMSELNSPQLCGYYPRRVPIRDFEVRSRFLYLPVYQGVEILTNDFFVNQDDYFIPAEIRLKVYPNPVTESVNFDLPGYDLKSAYYFKVTDINGKMIREGNVLHPTVNIDLSGLSPAVYYLQVEKDKKFYKAALFVKQ